MVALMGNWTVGTKTDGCGIHKQSFVIGFNDSLLLM
uniref:Uncharacterized protein n=1 Tax=Arundo donax TaxID=35708 RepID=A0A0A9FHP6_ARUDO